jgi:hypothetical protein
MAGADADGRNMDDATQSPAKPVRTPPFGSSGDRIADRRYGRARAYEAAGDLSGAAELRLQALERTPNFASAQLQPSSSATSAGTKIRLLSSWWRSPATGASVP